MRNALMGNTCYVVATVTAADWRMTVGFHALLMVVCHRPSPSRSLIYRGTISDLDPLSPFRSISYLSRRLAPAPPNYLRKNLSVFPGVLISSTSVPVTRARFYFGSTSRRSIDEITLQFNACFQLFRRVEKIT